MRRPKSLKVASIDIEIKWVEKLPELLGEFDGDKQRIRIRSKLSRDTARNVLLHEVKHAIWWAYGFHPNQKDLEESVVNFEAGAEVETLRANPRVMDYIYGP
jgi:hypothetical protein